MKQEASDCDDTAGSSLTLRHGGSSDSKGTGARRPPGGAPAGRAQGRAGGPGGCRFQVKLEAKEGPGDPRSGVCPSASAELGVLGHGSAG